MIIEASKVAAGTIHLTIMNIVSFLASFIFYVGIARVLTPKDMGLISLMFSTIAIFNTFTLLALNSAVIKYVSEHLGKSDIITASAVSRRVFKVITIISISALLISILISPLILEWFFQLQITMPIFLLLISVGIMLNYTNYYGAIMAGLAMFGMVAIQNILFSIGSRISALTLAFLGFKVDGVAFGFFLGAIICLTFSILMVRGKMKGSDDNFPLREILSFSIPIYIFNIIHLARDWMDILILYGLTSALTPTGIYYIAVASSQILSILWSPFAFALLPALSSRFGAHGLNAVNYALI
ncbi:MAG: oligosaccharide flippase family protein, partial [Nitrososphaerota archaeon]|nr:oligosaccharide flippase family protein [Nitrososphaerota archaeon]